MNHSERLAAMRHPASPHFDLEVAAREVAQRQADLARGRRRILASALASASVLAAAPFIISFPLLPRGSSVPTRSSPPSGYGEVAFTGPPSSPTVPGIINDSAHVFFTVDSGADLVLIPTSLAKRLAKQGNLTRKDYRGEIILGLADGSEVKMHTYMLRTITVADITVTNVLATVSRIETDLLLGQTFLSRFDSWSVDNQRRVLVLR